MNKILSISIATYNMEAFLCRCLDTLILDDKNIMDKLEVLIVNDGSKDRSSEIAHEYERRFPNTFRVIDKENGNYGSCQNRAMEEARGKYFKILDADDWYDKDALAALIKRIDSCNEDIDVFYTNFTYHNLYEGQTDKYEFQQVEYGKSYQIQDLKIADTSDIFMIKMYSIAIKTEILRNMNLRLDTGISYTDNEYTFMPMLHVNKVVFLNDNVYQYFIGREGQTVNEKSFDKYIRQVNIVANRMIDYYVANKKLIRTDSFRDLLSCLLANLSLELISRILNSKKCNDYNDMLSTIREKLKLEDSVISRIRRQYPFFVLWEKTGIYKSSPLVNKPYSALKNILGK